MQSLDNNIQAFLALVRAGLWEKDVHLSQYGKISYAIIYQLAEEQSVIGLVAAGLEHVTDVKIPQEEALTFAGSALQLERRNKAMNEYVAKLITELHGNDIYAILVKGQGIAQCYERPMWRASGDVDLLLSEDNYIKAKNFLRPKATTIETESMSDKHLGMTIEKWEIELHGTLHTELSARLDGVIDSVQNDVIYQGNVRTWMNEGTQVFLPSFDNDLIFIFTHYLKHFYKGGLGLRQICDWCRLLWVCKEKIDVVLLNKRLRSMRLMTEWKVFSTFAVLYLGMPSNSIPLYDSSTVWDNKAKRIFSFVMAVGNMGHNRDNSYFEKYPFIIRKCISFERRLSDIFNHALVFPLDSLRFFQSILFNGVRLAAKGVG